MPYTASIQHVAAPAFISAFTKDIAHIEKSAPLKPGSFFINETNVCNDGAEVFCTFPRITC